VPGKVPKITACLYKCNEGTQNFSYFHITLKNGEVLTLFFFLQLNFCQLCYIFTVLYISVFILFLHNEINLFLYSRLYCRGKVLGFRRGQRLQRYHTSLLKLEGVQTREHCNFYLGKRVAYIYRVVKKKNKPEKRVIWGRITRPHGNSGVVRAKFASNLPPVSMGRPVRVVSLYYY
jgi:large subunit ribosomal protein L35Ae